MRLLPFQHTFYCALILFAVPMIGCREEPVVTDTTATFAADTAGTAGGTAGINAPASTTNADALRASAADVIRNPSQYAGRVVTVTGDVDRVYTSRAFTMDGGITPGRDLLVLSRDPVPGVLEAGRTRAILSGDDAIVTGRVIDMVVTEVEREIGWDLDRELETDFERQPVLIIETVSATPDQGSTTTSGTSA